MSDFNSRLVSNAQQQHTQQHIQREDQINFLIVNDINLENAQKFYSHLLEGNKVYDYVILCGVLDENFETIMCQFGNMFKKVLYLNDDGEVSDLTNSINVNGRMYLLHEMLYIAGYDEFATELKDMNAVLDDILDDDMLEDQQMIRENFSINTAEKTIETISKLLYSTSKVTNDVNGPAGIFLLRYKYTHSLNKFLFYPDTSNTDSVKLLIVPSMSDEATRLPRTYSNLHILVPESYNTTGSYYTATMEFMENKWSVSTIIDNKEITESLLESP